MNRLAAILPLANVQVGVDATSKKRVFEQAGVLFENQHAIARATVTDNLFARERLKGDVDAATLHRLISDWEPLKSVA